MAGLWGKIAGTAGHPGLWGRIKSHPGQTALGGLLGMQFLSNILQGRKQSQALNRLLELQRRYAAITPEQMQREITGMVRPLDQALIQSVMRTVEGRLAQMGLSQAPGIIREQEAQALAPWHEQHLQEAINEWFGLKGLPLGATPPGVGFRGPQDLSPLLFMMMMNRAGPQSGTSGVGTLPITGAGGSVEQLLKLLSPGITSPETESWLGSMGVGGVPFP